MQYINQINLNTEDLGRLYWDRFDDRTIDALTPALDLAVRDGYASVPGFEDELRMQLTNTRPNVATITLFAIEDDEPLVTSMICANSRDGPRAWQEITGLATALGQPVRAERPSAPWVADVPFEIPETKHKELRMGVGEIIACLAWTWLMYIGKAK